MCLSVAPAARASRRCQTLFVHVAGVHRARHRDRARCPCSGRGPAGPRAARCRSACWSWSSRRRRARAGRPPVATKSLKPKLSRLNPFAGIKRMFGPQAVWEVVKALIKTRPGRACSSTGRSTGWCPRRPPRCRCRRSLELRRRLVHRAVPRRRGHRADHRGRRLRRRPPPHRQAAQDDEVGDQGGAQAVRGRPALKGALRSRQLSMARNRMMADVAEADVVLVNPTHVAVALNYEAAKGAPRVVAKGAGVIATPDPRGRRGEPGADGRGHPAGPGAVRRCEVGQEIPPELFTAVAQVLAFVLQPQGPGRAGRPLPHPARGRAAALRAQAPPPAGPGRSRRGILRNRLTVPIRRVPGRRP